MTMPFVPENYIYIYMYIILYCMYTQNFIFIYTHVYIK